MKSPLFCPVCDFVMTTVDDTASYQESGCCLPCQNEWGKDIFFEQRENLPAYKEYISKRIEQLKTRLPTLRFQ